MKKLKVLIVDDSSVMRKIVERALRQVGRDIGEVLEVSNGAEALAEVQKGSLDLIRSDMNMPVRDGLEFLKSIAGVEAAKSGACCDGLLGRKRFEQRLTQLRPLGLHSARQ